MTKPSPAAEPTGAFHSVFELSARDRKRILWAVALSIYYHALVISLQFGASGIGLLGFTIPWPEKRVETRPRDARIVEVPRAVQPALPATPALPRESPAAAASEVVRPLPSSRRAMTVELRYLPPAEIAPPPKALSAPRRETLARAPAAKARSPERRIRPKPRPPVLALRKPQEETFKMPAPKVADAEPQRAPEAAAKKQTADSPPVAQAEEASTQPAEDLARAQAEDAARQRAEEASRQRALALEKELEAQKQAETRQLEELRKQQEAQKQALEAEALKSAEAKAREDAEALARERALALQKESEAKKVDEAKRIEEARRQAEAAKQAELTKQAEAAKQAELKKQEAAREAELRKKVEEAARQAEIRKQEETKRLALEVEALKRAEELARQQAIARKEAEARRQAEEAASREREAAERARAEADAAAKRAKEGLAKQQAPAAAPGALSGKELASKAIDQLRAGRIDPTRPPSPAPGLDNPRRRAVAGIERDVSLRMYVESWRWKIERGGALNYRPSAAWRASENPIVTVSIRSDGSVEDVFIHRSSGLRELDEAVRRIARLHAPYSAFPPDLARQYDVIAIRRIWSFENTLRILDEM